MGRKLLSFYILLAMFCAFTFCQPIMLNITQNTETKTRYYAHQVYTQYTPVPPQCSIVHLELICRHGSRYPTAGEAKSIAAFQNTVKGITVSTPGFEFLSNWKSPFQTINAGDLCPTGMQELYDFSKRLQQNPNYAPLLTNNGTDYDFQPWRYYLTSTIDTTVNRAGMSGNSWSLGMFEGKGLLGPDFLSPFFMLTYNASYDFFLRFFNLCELYTLNVEDDPNLYEQADDYAALVFDGIAAEMTAAVNSSNLTFSSSDVSPCFEMCGFENAINHTTNRFCALFATNTSIDEMNFYFDLENYYEKYYGNIYSPTMACLLLQDIFNDINIIIAQETASPPIVDVNKRKGTFRFAHAETIFPLLAIMGLYNDTTPFNYMFPDIRTRVFRSSYINPFMANVMYELYNCGGGNFTVRVLHNEGEIILPGCPGVFCPVTTLQTLWNNALHCDWSALCNVPTSSETNDNNCIKTSSEGSKGTGSKGTGGKGSPASTLYSWLKN